MYVSWIHLDRKKRNSLVHDVIVIFLFISYFLLKRIFEYTIDYLRQINMYITISCLGGVRRVSTGWQPQSPGVPTPSKKKVQTTQTTKEEEVQTIWRVGRLWVQPITTQVSVMRRGDHLRVQPSKNLRRHCKTWGGVSISDHNYWRRESKTSDGSTITYVNKYYHDL